MSTASSVLPEALGGFAVPSGLELAMRIARDGLSGTVTIVQELPGFVLWFEDGQLIYVEGGQPSESLGRVLVQRKALTNEQYGACLAKLADNNGLFGEEIVAQRLLSQEAVTLGLQEQFAKKAARAMLCRGAHAEFEARVQDDPRKRIATGMQAVYHAVASWISQPLLDQALQASAEFFPNVESTFAGLSRAFSPFAMSRATFAELLSGKPVGMLSAPARRLLLATLLCRDASLSSEPAVSPLSDQALRESTPNPGEAAAEDPTTPESRAEDEQANAIGRMKINRLSVSVRKVPERDPRDEREARILAELHYVNARVLGRVNQWARVLPAIQSAVRLWPDAAEYVAVLSYVEFKIAGEGSDRLAKLTESANLAFETDPLCAYAWFIQGEAWLGADDPGGALLAFERALELDPDMIEVLPRLKIAQGRYERAVAASAEPVLAQSIHPDLPSDRPPEVVSIPAAPRSSVRPAPVVNRPKNRKSKSELAMGIVTGVAILFAIAVCILVITHMK